MTTFKRFEDIEAWQKARAMNARIFEMCRSRTFAHEFAISDQFKRASLSVMGNIAEGFERDGTAEFLHFLSVSKASAAECQSHLYAALDAKLINADTFDDIYARANECKKLIGGLMSYLRRSDLRGSKFLKKPGTRDSELGDSTGERPKRK